MKKFIMMICLVTSVTATFAQVKIGDNPNTINANSLLELEGTNKGFLPPRVALNSLTSLSPLTGTAPAGMMVYSSGGTLPDSYYMWNGTEWQALTTSAAMRDSVVIVQSETDFPAPSSGVITLAAGFLYEINGTVAMTNKININSCTIIGVDRAKDKLVYTPATGELFTGANGGTFQNITLSAPTAGSKLFNLDGGGALKTLIIEQSAISGCNNVGLIKGFGGVVVLSTVLFISNTSGITLENIGDFASYNEVWVPSNRNTFETFVGTFNSIQKLGGNIGTLSVFSAVGLNISGITSITSGASLKNNVFSGTGTYVAGTFSNKWEVESVGLDTEKDDEASANTYITTPATTLVAAINTPIKIAGTTVAVNAFRVTSPMNNRLTYVGAKTRRFGVDGALTVTYTGGGSNKYFSFYAAVNGVIVPSSKQSLKLASSTDQSSVALSCTIALMPNDYVEFWVENNTDDTDIIIQSMNMMIE